MQAATDTVKTLKDKIYAYAAQNSYVVSEENLDRIITGLIENKEEFGDYYCPCRVVKDNEKYRKAIVCPCVFVPKEIEKNGHCKCLLYFAKK